MRIQITKAPEFKYLYATGAYGGVGPTGDIQFVLVADRNVFPDAEEVVSDEAGRVIETRQYRSSQDQIIREMVMGVQMSAEAAEALARWLLTKVEERRKTGPGGFHRH